MRALIACTPIWSFLCTWLTMVLRGLLLRRGPCRAQQVKSIDPVEQAARLARSH